jgi:hypothetical protein
MAIKYRRDLNRELTADEVDENFRELALRKSVHKSYGSEQEMYNMQHEQLSNSLYRVNDSYFEYLGTLNANSIDYIEVNDVEIPDYSREFNTTDMRIQSSNSWKGFASLKYFAANYLRNSYFFLPVGGGNIAVKPRFLTVNDDSFTFNNNNYHLDGYIILMKTTVSNNPKVFSIETITNGAPLTSISIISEHLDLTINVPSVAELICPEGYLPKPRRKGSLITIYRQSNSKYYITGDLIKSIETKPLIIFDKVTPIEDDLILEASTVGWDSKIREIGNYFIDDDGKHYQLYTGYTGASGVNSRLGIAVSTDEGQTFQKAGANSDGKMFDTPSEDPSLVKKDGVYYLYSEESSNNPKKIQCHTSTDLITWVNRGIVIDFNGTDEWDASSVASPTAIIKDGVFYLFYEGLNSPYGQLGQVGLATSNDGINFTKSSDPIIATSGFKKDFPLNWTDEKETIVWGNSAVPDDIIYMNGVYIMSLHVGIDPQGNKDFRTAICYSYDLLKWKDLNNDKIDSPHSGISFIRNYKNLQATYIVDSKKLLKGAVIKSSDSITSNAIGSEELIHSKKEFISDGDTYINGKAKIQLDQFENDLDAYNNGVDYSQMYLNHLNIPVVNTSIYNLFGDSEPIDSSNVSASSVTFNTFNWGGFNDFTTAVNFDYSPSGQVFYLMPLTDGEIYNVSFFVKMDDGEAPRVNQTSTSPLSDFILLIGNEFASIDLKVEDYGNGIYRVSGFSEKGVSNVTGIRKGQFNSQRNFVATGFQITKGKDLKPYRKTPTTEIKQEDISGIYTTSKMFLQADYQLENVTQAQKVFNVGKNGNGSIPLIEDNTYYFEIDLTLTNLPTSNGAVKFGFLGTALGDLKYIASTVKSDSVSGINISVSSKQTSFTPVNITSFNDSTESTITIKGTIICTNSGDFIPAIQMSNLNNAIVEKSSYCFIKKIGDSHFKNTNDID